MSDKYSEDDYEQGIELERENEAAIWSKYHEKQAKILGKAQLQARDLSAQFAKMTVDTVQTRKLRGSVRSSSH